MAKSFFLTLLALVTTFATTALGQDYGTVNYIDAEGNTAECAVCTLVDSNYPFGDDNGVATLGVDDDTERWYAIVGTITLDKPLRVEGNAHIILCDDALLNINANTNDFAFHSTGSSLVIYGQAQGTGTLRACNTNSAIGASDGNHITINGGTVNAIGSDNTFNFGISITNGSMFTINRGTVNAKGSYCGILAEQQGILTINGGIIRATCTGGSIFAAIGIIENSTATINGGNVTATGIDIGWGAAFGISVNTNSILTFGLTNDSDRITASSYYVGNNSTLQIADGKPLTNGIEDLEPGVVSDLTKLNGKTLMPYIPEELTSSHTIWENGKTYVLNSDVTISERITVYGSVKLVLGAGFTLMAPKGIELTNGNKLTIDGRGTLNIYNCDTNKSGIGAYSAGTLIIKGGILNVKGGQYGAGLGGDAHDYSSGDITINDGVVNATGGEGAAGIGGGYNDWSGNYGGCGTITINGGQVTATGGATAYGIGPGTSSDGEKSGTVVLGWTTFADFIYATGGAGSYSSRIQSLSFAEGKSFVLDGTETEATLSNIDGQKIVPNIPRTGLRYDLTGDDKPSLADVTLLVNMMTYEDSYKYLVPMSPEDVVLAASDTIWENGKTYLLNSDVTIGKRIMVDGTVRLVLGTGCTLNIPKGIELSNGNQLTIEGRGTLNIDDCDDKKSGIGAYDVGKLIINSGIINVTGGDYAAGLGGDENNISGGTIIINGGVVNATGGLVGAGIGGGPKYWAGNYGVCGTIIINGGQVTAKGGRSAHGIGPGPSGNRLDLSMSGTVVLGWTLATDFIHALSQERAYDSYAAYGFSGRIENFSFAEGKTFLLDDTGVEANSSVEYLTWDIYIGDEDSPKLVPDYPDTGLKGDMNGDGKLTQDDLPVLVDAVLYVTSGPVPVSSIILSTTEMTLDAHGFDAPFDFYITATVGPRNATNKELEWSSTNWDLVGIEVDGKTIRVYAEGIEDEGECYITATAKDGSGVKASCKVTVFTSHHSYP